MTDPIVLVVKRISLQRISARSVKSYVVYAGRRCFLSKNSWKNLFHSQNDWSSHGPAGQFWLLKRALSVLYMICSFSINSPPRPKGLAGCQRLNIRYMDFNFVRGLMENALRKGWEKRKVSQNPFRAQVVVQNFGGQLYSAVFSFQIWYHSQANL